MIHIAIIGCGRIARHHCRAIKSIEGLNAVAVCDLEIEKAYSIREEYGVKAYSDYRCMLQENPQIDVVAVITPSGMHYEHSMEIMREYKKHVIVEKPTYLKTAHLKEAYALAKQCDVQVFPVFQNRYNLAVRRVLEGLRNDELGAIRLASVRVRWCRPQRYYDLAPWRGTFTLDGGCLTNQAIHHIDLLRMFCGNPKQLVSKHKTLGADVEVEDCAVASIEFDGGSIGSVEVTTAARPIDYEASLSLVCEKGLAQIGGIAVNELQVYTPDPSACEPNSEDFSGSIYGNGHQHFYEDLLVSLTKQTPFPCTFEQTLSSLQFLNALYRSDELDAWVDVSSCGDSDRLGRENDALCSIYRTPKQV